MLPLVPSEAGDLATLWWLFPVGSALLRGDSVGMLGEAVERVPAGALPVITTTWVLSGFRPDARLRFRCRLDEPAAGRALAWVSLEGVGVAPSVPTLGDRPFPDRIERVLEIPQPPATVWTAITTAEGLSSWFGDEVRIDDLRPGGTVRMSWTSGDTAEMRIERVEEPTVFGYTWHVYGLPEDDPRRTYVEFALVPVADGTRLTVSESGFAQLPDDAHDKAFGGNTQGWASELGELVAHLAA
jgi:uncharacterized protein YndB with AHSA1/START domain